MKRFLVFLLCVLMICSLSACAPKSASPEDTSAPVDDNRNDPADEQQLVEYGEPAVYQWVELDDTEPCFEIIVPVKNVSDEYVYFRGTTYTLKDKDGSVIGEFSGADCAPMYLAPGEEGIIYHASINRSGIDYTNPEFTLDYVAEPMNITWEITPLEVTDIRLSRNLGCTEIRGSVINDTDIEFSLPGITFLFYDKDGNILCGAYCMGGVDDYEAEDFGMLHANSTCPFYTYRYWLPNDYPIEDVTVKGIGFGVPD